LVRVAYFQNECAPYRMPIFKEIAMLPNVKLKVYFGRYRSLNRKWAVKLDNSFDYEILREVNFLEHAPIFSFNPEDIANPLNLSLPLKLLRNKYDLFIGGVPHYFGTISMFLISKLLKKPFILFLEEIDYKGGEISSFLARFRKYASWKLLSFPLIAARFIFWQVVLRHSNCYVVPGTSTKEYLLRRGILASKIFTAWNVIDNESVAQDCQESLNKGNPEKLRASLGLENKKIILSVAYLEERKGLHYLIQAYAKLKEQDDNISLIIVGDGPFKQNLKELAAENNIPIVFVGYVKNLVDYYLAADIFVLPTLQDVWGFVINEAMVCGCPIVTTYNAGASRDLVRQGTNGYVVEIMNVGQLYQALKRIMTDERLRQSMKEASRNIIRDFSFKNSVEGYRAAIDFAIRQKRKPYK
jgi:glycosyltransferase involved in cell wall biosynthesis